MDGNIEERKVWGIHTQNDNLFLMPLRGRCFS